MCSVWLILIYFIVWWYFGVMNLMVLVSILVVVWVVFRGMIVVRLKLLSFVLYFLFSKILVGFKLWCMMELLRDLLWRYVSFWVILYKMWWCLGYDSVKLLVVIWCSVFCRFFFGMYLYINKWEFFLKMYVNNCIKFWWWMKFRVLSFVWICFVLWLEFEFFLVLFEVMWIYFIVMMRLFWRGIWYIFLFFFVLRRW